MELLEKRVKSRFSHRQIHLCPKFSLDDYVAVFRMYLLLRDDVVADADFVSRWNRRVDVGGTVSLLAQLLGTAHKCCVTNSEDNVLTPYTCYDSSVLPNVDAAGRDMTCARPSRAELQQLHCLRRIHSN